MRVILSVWLLVNVSYLFGFYTGYNATEWWVGLPFVGTSLLATIVIYKLRTK